jgi:hypothetical protein
MVIGNIRPNMLFRYFRFALTVIAPGSPVVYEEIVENDRAIRALVKARVPCLLKYFIFIIKGRSA